MYTSTQSSTRASEVAIIFHSMVAAPRGAVLATSSALIVSSDASDRQFYVACLQRASYEIDEASDGREALAKAMTRPYGAIVMETPLPGIDGFSLCELVKHDPTIRHTPIVFITISEQLGDIDRARRAGADSILLKPCGSDVLVLEVGRVVQRSHEIRSRADCAVDAAEAEQILPRGKRRPGRS